MSPLDSGRARLLVRPTLDTKFHIDFDWWERTDQDWHVFLRSHLCAEHQKAFESLETDAQVDHVDPVTAEVSRVAGIEHTLIAHCARQPEYITPQTSLINAVFRMFLANGNTPLSPIDMSDRLHRPPLTILKTLTGPTVYKGIRPSTDS
jgi:hypothetical protein